MILSCLDFAVRRSEPSFSACMLDVCRDVELFWRVLDHHRIGQA